MRTHHQGRRQLQMSGGARLAREARRNFLGLINIHNRRGFR